MTSTTPFSGVTREQITQSLIARARIIATARGDAQIGFRDTATTPYHTRCYTDPQRGPALGDSSEMTEWDQPQGDWVVRDDHWTLVRG